MSVMVVFIELSLKFQLCRARRVNSFIGSLEQIVKSKVDFEGVNGVLQERFPSVLDLAVQDVNLSYQLPLSLLQKDAGITV